LYEEPLVYSNFCKRLDPIVPIPLAAAAWMQLVFAYRTGEVAKYRTGSAFPNLDIDALMTGLEITLPDLGAAVNWFALLALALDPQSRRETALLAEIRDALLPKLISGEIRVPETRDPDEVIGPAAERLAAATP